MSRIEQVEPAASAASAAASSAPAGMKALLTTIAGSGAMVGGGLTSSDIAIYGGMVATAIGLLIQIVTARRRDQREQSEERRREAQHRAVMAEHAARMKMLE